MSTMYISEYADVGRMGGIIPVGAEPGTDQTPVTFTGTAGVSAAFANNTNMVRIHVDGIASIKFGTAPTAVANTNKRMTAGQTEYFTVPMGGAYKVSAVTST
jgi:hypothetical protein